MKATRVDTWAASIDDQPGALAGKLKALSSAGVNLEFVVARRVETPGKAVVFVTPIKGGKQIAAGGRRASENLPACTPSGSRGRTRLARAVASCRRWRTRGSMCAGFPRRPSAKKFICHVALDTDADVTKAVRALQKF